MGLAKGGHGDLVVPQQLERRAVGRARTAAARGEPWVVEGARASEPCTEGEARAGHPSAVAPHHVAARTAVGADSGHDVGAARVGPPTTRRIHPGAVDAATSGSPPRTRTSRQGAARFVACTPAS